MARIGAETTVLALLLVGLIGCAAVPDRPGVGGGSIEGQDAPSVPPSRPMVQLNVAPGSHPVFRSVAEETTDASGLFSSRIAATAVEPRADYSLDLSFQVVERPLRDAEQIWSATTMLLLTMYPSTCNRYRFTLKADVRDNQGNLIKSYWLDETDTAWLWLFMGPKCGSPEGMSGEGISNVATSQMKELFARARRDGVFDMERSTAVVAGAGPMVLVRAAHAHEEIERGLQLDEPAVRFNFDESRASEADYMLDVDVEFTGGDFSPSRGYLAILTLGLSGVCSLTHATLTASLLDRNSELVGHYSFQDSAQATMAEGCQRIDERSRPDLVVGLARKLNKQLKQDRLSARPATLAGALTPAPLVYVSTNCLQPVVEEVTATVAPFKRVTFMESAEAQADYHLVLQFDSNSANAPMDPHSVSQGLLRGVTYAWDLHRLVCKSTTVTVDALLQARDGREIAAYRFEKSEQTLDGFCNTDAPETHPKAIATLTREVYDKLRNGDSLAGELGFGRSTTH